MRRQAWDSEAFTRTLAEWLVGPPKRKVHEFAAQIGATDRTVRLLRKAGANPSIDLVVSIAKVLDVSIDDLLL